MFDWILHNRDVFQMSYVEIGHNYSLAKSLQEEHQKFAVASMNVCVNINRILAVAVRLKEGKTFGSNKSYDFTNHRFRLSKAITTQLSIFVP